MFKKTSILITISIFLITNPGFASSISIELEKNSAGLDEKPWTFIVYLDGDNNLEKTAKKAFNLLETAGSNEDINIIVEFDSLLLFEGVRRYYVTHDTSSDITSEIIETLDEKNMGDPSTLIDFVTWVCTNYPAERYCLILYDHGNGWRPSFLIDETDNDDLSMSELKNAMNNIKQNIGEKIDLLIFDACLMGMTEVYYQIRECVEVVLGSEDVVYGTGLPYHMILSALKNNPSTPISDFVNIILTKYSQYYNHFPMAMGALNLNDFTENVVEKNLDDFAVTLNNVFNMFENEIREAIEHTTAYNVYYNGEKIVTHYRDLYDFAYEIKKRIPDEQVQNAAEKLTNEISRCTIAAKQNKKEESHGVSIYLPNSKKDYDTSYEELDLCRDTNWDVFILKCLTKKHTSELIEKKTILLRGLLEKIIYFL